MTTASIAGDYFVALQLDPLAAFLSGRVMQVRLSLVVDGQPSGQPEYMVPSPTPSASESIASTATPNAGSRVPFGALLAGAGVLAAGLVASALAITRRRRQLPRASEVPRALDRSGRGS